MAQTRSAVATAATLLAAVVVGCGQSPGDASPGVAADGGFPVTVGSGPGRVTLERSPRRIVSISPTATETLFAIGAGDRVVAVDDQSDWPPEAPTTKLSAYQPNVEAIAGYRPDLVVASDSLPREAIAGLRRLGVALLVQPAAERLADAYAQIRELGAATGRRAAAARVARRVRGRVRDAIAAAGDGPSLKVFHELDADLFSASSQTFIGRIYARLGLRNVADAAARRSGSPYPQLSAEAVVAADPDLIVLADGECCGQTPAKVADRAGWGDVAAVRRGAIVAVDDDIASRWGPRVPRLVAAVAEAIRAARSSAGSGR